ncbi:hypothetical protein [Shouchella patagoniensis]|uniref:hypothetical protein n=1 Tax=Shouchella patagoniensis TaxID=228576 RepID=UPI0014730170|nr:hypothetical protein [Shouchella patagoniensis]
MQLIVEGRGNKQRIRPINLRRLVVIFLMNQALELTMDKNFFKMNDSQSFESFLI